MTQKSFGQAGACQDCYQYNEIVVEISQFEKMNQLGRKSVKTLDLKIR